jgi:TonB family protein
MRGFRIRREVLVVGFFAIAVGFGVSASAQDAGGDNPRSGGEERTCSETGSLQAVSITVERALDRVESKLDKDDLDGALRALNKIKIRRAKPFDQATVQYYRGGIYARAGDVNLAVDAYRAAMDESPLPDIIYFVLKDALAAAENARDDQVGWARSLKIHPLRLYRVPYEILEKGSLKYPDTARKLGVEGMVVLSFTITEDGTVEQVRAIGASPPTHFKGPARSSMKDYRFQPVLACDRPVRIEKVIQTIYFRLTQRLRGRR